MIREELIAMSYVFVSYIFRDSRIKDKINRIFLFGSVARNDFDENSDIDIFIDVNKKYENHVQKVVQRALNRFYYIDGKKFQLRDIKNKISPKVGFLEEWKLKSSIESESLVLFSSTSGSRFVKYLLFYFDPIKSPKKRVKIMRYLYGRKEKGYRITGLVQNYGGRIINPRVFIIPSSNLKEISFFLSKEKINFAFEEIWQ